MDLRSADLRSAILRSAILRGADLRSTDLVHADLRSTDLAHANLTSAYLTHANLTRADLFHADLTSADLSGANLTSANLTSANLSGASLSSANLDGANLDGTDLSHASVFNTIFGGTNLLAKGLESCQHLGPSTLDFRTLELSGMLPLVFLRGCGLPENLIEYLPSLLNQAIEFYSCFISYNHTDNVFAQRLHDKLQGQGIRCWLDEHQMKPGHDIYEEIQRGIKLWDKVLLCCSKDSLTSWWVDNEIDTAFKKERGLMKERGKKVKVLIPLDLDGYLFSGQWQSGKEEQVKSRIAANFKGWKRSNEKFDRAFEAVLQGLRTDDGRAPPPTPKL